MCASRIEGWVDGAVAAPSSGQTPSLPIGCGAQRAEGGATILTATQADAAAPQLLATVQLSISGTHQYNHYFPTIRDITPNLRRVQFTANRTLHLPTAATVVVDA